MNPTHETYIRGQFASCTVNDEPFRHICIRNILPPDLYAEMEAAFPSQEELQRVNVANRLRHFARHPRIRFWRSPPETIGVYISEVAPNGRFPKRSRELHERYTDCIDLVERLIHEKFATANLWQSGQRILYWRPSGWSVVPHTHSESELSNAMIYFPTKANTPDQGTIFYRKRGDGPPKWTIGTDVFDSRDVEPAAIIPFVPNTLISWINSPEAIHGSVELERKPAPVA
jgi:hypothetical protein